MTTVIVLAKECVPGRVKTRLTPPFSSEEAAALAAASLAPAPAVPAPAAGLGPASGLDQSHLAALMAGAPPPRKAAKPAAKAATKTASVEKAATKH